MSVKIVAHILAAIHFWFGCYYDWHYVKIPVELTKVSSPDKDFGKLKYLTYWDALLQGAFFTICAVNDIYGSRDGKGSPTGVTKLRNLMLSCLAFPLSMFVGISFWGLYLVDRELIFPRALDPFFPSWLNHLMHTNIMIFILIEMFTSQQSYPPRKKGLTVLLTFMLTYLIWVHYIYAKTGTWVYPVLYVLPWPFKILFYLALLGMSVALYIAGEKLNNVFMHKRRQSVKTN